VRSRGPKGVDSQNLKPEIPLLRVGKAAKSRGTGGGKKGVPGEIKDENGSKRWVKVVGYENRSRP